MPTVSRAGAVVLLAVLIVGIGERIIPWWVGLIIGALLPFMRFALHVVLSRLLGPTVDPFSDR